MSIRAATVDDAYRLADIVFEATRAQGRFPELSAAEHVEWRDGFADWSRQTVRESDPDNVLSVILSGQEIIGRLRVVRDGASIRLAGIQLVPSAQNRGIGTAIVRDLQATAARQGVPLLIGVEKDNPDARRLYERLGCHLTEETDDEYLLQWTPGPTP